MRGLYFSRTETINRCLAVRNQLAQTLGSAPSQIAILVCNDNLNPPIYCTTIDARVVRDWVRFAVAFGHDAGGVYAAGD